MPFLTEPEPPREVPLPVLPGIRRIVAANPGPMTYYGTNTYLIDSPAGLLVLDPGPEQTAHVRSILDATGGRVVRILVSHTHWDHVGAAAELRAKTGAPTVGFKHSASPTFVPDEPIDDGTQVAGLTALHTPGHAADHLCFAMQAHYGQAVLFSADHVMSWSSSVISPPGGDMAAYLANLERLLDRRDDLYLTGHGPPLAKPQTLVRELLARRREREDAILQALAAGPLTVRALTDRAYAAIQSPLRLAAERTTFAHLLKLEAEGRVLRRGEMWRRA
ncbi:MAG: MBL fold metallo-hydrolase [Acetobacteraceae bacterium]|nr:MBL fold metallo-hydrolase [Acetobacteraceae bacterium]